LTPLPSIAEKLAAALRNMPCLCVVEGFWPWKKPRTCARCAALAEYDAFVAIVQVPKVKP
jgi:hypothetical protein